nr:hypothetical protein [Tanacetum cinerariifolium]
MARFQFCDYHNMVAILEKGEFNTDFHPMVDFIAASPLRYALTMKPTVFISHIRQFWSTARIETTDEGTHILATVDGYHVFKLISKQVVTSMYSPPKRLKTSKIGAMRLTSMMTNDCRNAHFKCKAKRKPIRLDQEVAANPNSDDSLD